MSKKAGSDLMAALRQQRQESMADVPPVLKVMEAVSQVTPPSPPPLPPVVEAAPPVASPVTVKPRAATKPAKAARPVPTPAEAEREKTSVYLTGNAGTALRKLQAFLMVDCGAGTTGVAAVVNVALLLAAEGLPDNKAELVELLDRTRQFDKRRRAAE